MSTVDQILQQQDNYSDLSVEASFTLEDILQEPADQQLIETNVLHNIDNLDAYFDDDSMFQDPQPTQPPLPSPSPATPSQPCPSAPLAPTFLHLQSLPPPPQPLPNMQYIPLKNVSQVFDISNSEVKGVGIPTCISSSGSKFLAVGTSIGNIVLFEIGVKGHRNLCTNDQNKYGQVISLSVSRDSRYLVAGYETGLVNVWDLYSFKLVKNILLQKNKVLKVLFCGQNYENFVSSDAEGYIYMHTIENYLWTGVKNQLLFDKTDNVYYDIKYSRIKSGRQILALTTFDEVLLVSLKPTVEAVGSIKRPDGVLATKLPNCQIGQSQDNRPAERSATVSRNRQDYVCISWGKQIHVYRLVPSPMSPEIIVKDFIIQQPSGIHNMNFITNGILVTIDNRQVYRIINLHSAKQQLLDSPSSQQPGNVTKNGIINTSQLQTQTIYQRHIRDKQSKYIKSYTNTIVSCSHNPKHKQIFLIAKNAIYRGRLNKWTDYVHGLLTEDKNWQLALKLCLELYKGRFNVFVEPFLVGAQTLGLLCDIGRIFWKERMKEVEGRRTELDSIAEVQPEARRLFEITVEYFCIINCEEYMFGTLYPNLKQGYFYQYQPLFLDTLRPFVMQSLLNRLPNRSVFVRIVEYYSHQPQVINKLVISLNEESLYFEDIVEICTREGLFEALGYICAINGDYISPANKIIKYVQRNLEGKQEKQRQQYKQQKVRSVSVDKTVLQHINLLKNYLETLISGHYPPNRKPIPSLLLPTMLSQLSIWLSCTQTLQWMLQHYNTDYFHMLSLLTTQMLALGLLNQIPTLITHVLENVGTMGAVGTGTREGLEWGLARFGVGVGLIEAIHYSTETVKGVLQVCVRALEGGQGKDPQFVYVDMLAFMEKYLLDPHAGAIRDEYEAVLLPRVDAWVRVGYRMLARGDVRELVGQHGDGEPGREGGREWVLGYLFGTRSSGGNKKNENNRQAEKYKEIIAMYEDVLILWSPEQCLSYITETKGPAGIATINAHLANIADEHTRYLVTRRVIRLLRQRTPSIEPEPTVTATTSTISPQILLFYLSCICKYKPQKRVFYQLSQNLTQYQPILTDCLSLMTQYKYHSCLGLINQQQHNYPQAFTHYALVYRQHFMNNFIKLVSHEYCHGRFMARVFHLMLQLCMKIRQESQWSLLMESVLTPLQQRDPSLHSPTPIIATIQAIYQIKSSQTHPFIQQLLDILQLTLTSTSRQISIGGMGQLLSKYTDLLQRSFFVGCLVSTLRNCGSRVEMYEISRKLMVSEFVGEFGDYFQGSKVRGLVSGCVCDGCGGVAGQGGTAEGGSNEDKFYMVKCGHGYHHSCFRKCYYQCRICTRKEYGDTVEAEDKQEEGTPSTTNQGNAKKEENTGQTPGDTQRSEDVYRYLAFEDYLRREDQGFEQFRSQYQGYINAYKQQ